MENVNNGGFFICCFSIIIKVKVYVCVIEN